MRNPNALTITMRFPNDVYVSSHDAIDYLQRIVGYPALRDSGIDLKFASASGLAGPEFQFEISNPAALVPTKQ